MSNNHPFADNEKLPDGTAIIEGPDGIKEYDYPMPRWMTMTAWGSMIWGAAYLLAMPGLGVNLLGYSQYKVYEGEIAEAKAKYGDSSAADPAALVAKAIADPAAAERGKAAFSANCAACHGAEAKGAIGPDLTDATWLYGGEPEKIVHTIAEGTSKGMPPFKSSLSPEQLADVTAFVKSLSK